VAISRYRPSWAARSRGIIIVPGYFGSSRHGPYGLYSRLARAWAWEGYDVVCLDPLGSGDSTSVFRTFDTEVESVETVSAWLAEQVESLVIVGHSMGGATALQASRNAAPRKDAVWCLAPICRLEDLSRSFFSPAHMDELLTEGHTYRHGLELRTDFIRESGAAWEWHSHRAAALWLAGADAYTEGMSLSGIPPDRIFTIPGADHNFSTNGSAPYLIEATTQALIDSDPRIAEHL
jgi:pimeloyl-ACP methyl ester carboxylesterase